MHIRYLFTQNGPKLQITSSQTSKVQVAASLWLYLKIMWLYLWRQNAERKSVARKVVRKTLLRQRGVCWVIASERTLSFRQNTQDPRMHICMSRGVVAILSVLFNKLRYTAYQKIFHFCIGITFRNKISKTTVLIRVGMWKRFILQDVIYWDQNYNKRQSRTARTISNIKTPAETHTSRSPWPCWLWVLRYWSTQISRISWLWSLFGFRPS